MIYISSDSSSDLNWMYAERDVKVLPIVVTLGGESFDDGVNITPDDIYAYTTKTGVLPKTSARSTEEYREFFASILKNEDDSLVFFSLSSGISVSCHNAMEAAKDFKNVYVVDGLSLSSGTGLLVLYACDLRDSGKYTAQEIYDKATARVPFVQASFFVETMEYLHKGGRCSGVKSLVASLLKIKPSLLMKDGKIAVGKKYKGKAVKIAEQYVDNIFEMYDNPDLKRIFITHTSADKEVVDIIRAAVEKHYNFENVYETIASSTITSHCGKGTIGILFINDGSHEE